MGLVRKLLFVLQTDWYHQDSIPFVVEALKAAAESNFSKEDAIKPIVSYLAANLHGGTWSFQDMFRFDLIPQQIQGMPVHLFLSFLASTIRTHTKKPNKSWNC